MKRIGDRASDEKTLALLSARAKGLSLSQAGAPFGMTARAVHNRTKAVIDADRAHDPLDFDEEAYW